MWIELFTRVKSRLDPSIIHERIKKTATTIAESAGAAAEVNIKLETPVTFNDPKLTAQMTPTLERLVGQKKVVTANLVTGAEDFAFHQEKIPGLFFFLGITPPGTNRFSIIRPISWATKAP